MTPSFAMPPPLRRDLDRWRTPALGVGVVLLLACFIAAFFVPADFFHGYLIGLLFWSGLALGSMAFLMTQYLTGGAWGVVTRRVFESAISTLPLMAVLFIPLFFGLPSLYDWAHPSVVQANEVLRHRAGYMNPTWFIIRAIVYFAVWIALAHFLNRWSREQDMGEPGRQNVLEKLSAPGLIIYVFSVTFAAVDWALSLHSNWFSTMWGFLFVASQGLTAMAFAILASSLLRRHDPMRTVLRPSLFNDLGNLLLMMVMLWAYFAFSQLLIVWSGNLLSEISWYLPRLKTSWAWIGGALILFEFALPFFLLLFRPIKRNPALLCIVVGIILTMRFIDLVWVVLPAHRSNGVHIGWLDFAAPLGIGGLWIWVFLGQLPRRPLLPANDPELEEALAHGDD